MDALTFREAGKDAEAARAHLLMLESLVAAISPGLRV
jgi:hypothetical protein